MSSNDRESRTARTEPAGSSAWLPVGRLIVWFVVVAIATATASGRDLRLLRSDGSATSFRLVSDEMVVARSLEARPVDIRALAMQRFGRAVGAVRSVASDGRLFGVDLGTSLAVETWLDRAEQLRADDAIRCVYPVLINPASGLRAIATDEILVRLADGISVEEVSQRARPFRLRPLDGLSFDDRIVRFRIENPRPFATLDLSNSLFRSGVARWAEPNFVVEIRRAFLPNDEHFSLQWHLHNTGQTGGRPDADVDAPEAWDITRGSPEIIIAILDDGMDLDHPDLRDNIFVNPGEIPGNGLDDDRNGYIDDVSGWDFLANDNHPGIDDPLGDYHSTKCAGMAAARADNTVGVAGVAPRCTILPLRIVGLKQPTVEQVARAIQYAGAKADVLSMSWTGETYETWKASLLYAANEGRRGLGCLLCAAAGNTGGVEGVGFPARLDFVMGIGASDVNDLRADYSDYNAGYGVFLLAPSADSAYTNAVFTTVGGGTYGWFNGTSASTPQVAAVGALLLTVAPGLSRTQVENILRGTADKIDPANAHYDAQGYSVTHGYGRLNAHGALLAATPDLAPLVFDFEPEVVARGEAVRLSGSVRNLGPGPSGAFWLEFWLSHSPTFSTLDAFALPSVGVPSLAAGAELRLEALSNNLLPTVPDGYYRFGVVVDRINEQEELNESNNTLYTDYRFLEVGAGSTDVDLAVEGWDFAPDTVVAGASIDLRGRVVNRGAQMSRAVWGEFRVSLDATGQTVGTFACDSVAIGPLGPGESLDLSALHRTIYGPAQGLPDGRYRLGIVLDPTGSQTETDEANNVQFRLDKWLTVGNATAVQSWTFYR